MGWIVPLTFEACCTTSARVGAALTSDFDHVGVEHAGVVGLGDHDLDAALRQRVKRADDGVVLHRRDDDSVARVAAAR